MNNPIFCSVGIESWWYSLILKGGMHISRFHTSNSSILQDKGLQHMVVIITSSLAMFWLRLNHLYLFVKVTHMRCWKQQPSLYAVVNIDNTWLLFVLILNTNVCVIAVNLSTCQKGNFNPKVHAGLNLHFSNHGCVHAMEKGFTLRVHQGGQMCPSLYSIFASPLRVSLKSLGLSEHW